MKLYRRRDFLKLTALGIGGLAFRPVAGLGADLDSSTVARVAVKSVSVYSRPSDQSTILYQRHRDELIHIYDEIISEDGPGYNPLWYRVWRGYVHSAYLQRVQTRLNPIPAKIEPESGVLAEVTVPYSQTMRYNSFTRRWEPLYRLYYQSTHWVVGIDEGPDGAPWFLLHDELNEARYHVRADHLRLLTPAEFAPISPDVKPSDKRIEISIAMQSLTAYEKDQVVLHTSVATGLPDRRKNKDLIPTNTPTGTFNVYSKMASKHMGNGQLTADLEAYELPGVPWTTFFAPHGVAIHGTYWHTNYGITMSRGCVNMRPEEAQWIFRWTTPVTAPETWEQTGLGTLVIVR